MVRSAVRKRQSEDGQAVVFVLLGMSIFLLGAVGLAIDGSQLYAQRQMAQAAADGAATAGIVSIFNGTNTGTNTFGASAYDCTASNATTPCVYARNNGFGATSGTGADTVHVDPNPGVSVSNLDGATPNELQVTVTRPVSMTLTKLLGLSSFNVKANATAAIVDVLSPIPILVLHPSLSGSFSKNGTNTIQICGGPRRSIQVDSGDSGSVSISGTSGTVDLSKAGPNDPGNCTTGTGADFGNHGGPTAYPGTILLGSTGSYRDPVGFFDDPLKNLSPPAQPAAAPSATTVSPGTGTCPSNLTTLTSLPNCTLYSPGYYANGIQIGGASKAFAIFRPGIYYINHGGFHLTSNVVARMAEAPNNVDNNTGTGWTNGMLVYNNPQTPVQANKDYIEITANSGKINNQTFPDATACGTDSSGNPLGGNCLVGANGGTLSAGVCDTSGAAAAMYYGILFFQSHTTATSLTHSLQGGGGLSIKGTIYLTHLIPNINTDGTYQSLSLQGTSGSTTKVQGEIIVDTLSLGGTSGITMNLSSLSCYTVRQIALVQ